MDRRRVLDGSSVSGGPASTFRLRRRSMDRRLPSAAGRFFGGCAAGALTFKSQKRRRRPYPQRLEAPQAPLLSITSNCLRQFPGLKGRAILRETTPKRRPGESHAERTGYLVPGIRRAPKGKEKTPTGRLKAGVPPAARCPGTPLLFRSPPYVSPGKHSTPAPYECQTPRIQHPLSAQWGFSFHLP